MKKIKVCHVTSAHPPKDVRIFTKECISLANAGYDVYLVEQGNNERSQNVTIIGCGKVPNNRFKRMVNFTHKVIKKAIDIDAAIYHLHDPELLPYALKLKAMGKKVIFDSHEDYPLQIKTKEYLQKHFRSLLSIVYYKFETFVLKKIDAAIIPCTINGRNILEGRAKRTEYIDNYPCSADFYDAYDEYAQKQGYVCYVGTLAYARGIYHLTKAAALAKVPLVLAGKYPMKRFEKEMHNLPEYTNVDYRGFVSRKEAANIYKGSLAGMCTLLNYGQYYLADNFPTKILEYMAMGLPVIVYDYPYARKVMQTYKFGICVKPDSIEEISAAIKYIVDNPLEAYKMGQEGRRAVKEKFNWNTQAKKLVQLYEELSMK